MLFELPKGSWVTFDESSYPIERSIYTRANNINTAIRNIKIQQWKISNVWWQYIHFYKEDITVKYDD